MDAYSASRPPSLQISLAARSILRSACGRLQSQVPSFSPTARSVRVLLVARCASGPQCCPRSSCWVRSASVCAHWYVRWATELMLLTHESVTSRKPKFTLQTLRSAPSPLLSQQRNVECRIASRRDHLTKRRRSGDRTATLLQTRHQSKAFRQLRKRADRSTNMPPSVLHDPCW